MREFDLVVIGSGPAGQKAAIQAAKLGKRVVVIEKEEVLGGAWINTGTLPSKTLKDAIYYLHGFRMRAFSELALQLRRNLTFRDLMARKDQVIRHELDVVMNQLQRNDVEVVHGTGSFVDANTVRVVDLAGGEHELLRGKYFLLATGSRPRRPADIPFDDVRVCDSDSVLRTDGSPRSMVVMGGGVVGCEYASMFASFGIRVTLLDRRHDLLRFVDREVSDALLYQMRQNGMTVWLGEEIAGVDYNFEGKVVTTLKTGKVVVSDMLLYAMGRLPNSDGLNLPEVGIVPDKNGQIPVDENYRSAVPHIYAAGDVIGFPALAATSMEQGRLAACHMFRVPQATLPKLFPLGIYTVPEISAVGKTEEELTAEGVPYEVGRAFYREIARGQIVGDLGGLLKLTFHRETLKLLGVHIIGEGATELVHIGQAVMTYGGQVDFFVHNVFNFPTLAECYRTAALDGINRLGVTA